MSTTFAPAGTYTPPRTHRTGTYTAAQLVRFAVAGGAASILYAAVTFLGAAATWDVQVVHVGGTILSTVAANELHRTFTFRGASRPGILRAQTAGGTIAIVGFLASTLALALLHHYAPGSGPAATVTVVWAATGAVGLANFLLLRHRLGAGLRSFATT